MGFKECVFLCVVGGCVPETLSYRFPAVCFSLSPLFFPLYFLSLFVAPLL